MSTWTSSVSYNNYSPVIMNTINSAISTYSNFAFDDIIEIDGITLMSNSTGLYKMTGDLDISTVIISAMAFPTLDLHLENIKYPQEVLLTGRGLIDFNINITVDEERTDNYQVNGYNPVLNDHRIKLAKGYRAEKRRFYRVNLTSSGLGFDLDTVRMPIQQDDYRIK